MSAASARSRCHRPGPGARVVQRLQARIGPNERNKSGLGLGLQIAQAIVKSHNGSIACNHADGQVVFTVRMPR